MDSLRVATDVGGTFTDLVAFSTDAETGRQEILTAKSGTTPPDFERGVLDVIAKSGVTSADVASSRTGRPSSSTRSPSARA